MIDLGALQAGGNSVARDINNAGQVVGTSASSSGYHAFLYSDGVMNDLNSLAAAQTAGWSLTDAMAINSSGQVVGTGTINGQSHAFLLTPTSEVPEPSVALLMLAGILGMAGIRCCRWPGETAVRLHGSTHPLPEE